MESGSNPALPANIGGLKGWLSRLETVPYNLIGARIVQVVAGLVILYRIATELPAIQFLYGSSGIAVGSLSYLLGPRLAGWLDPIFYSGAGIYLMFAIWGLGGLGLLLGKAPRISTALALMGYILLENRTIVNDGGDNLLRICLLYMIFLHPAVVNGGQVKPGPAVFMHNLAVLAIYLQVSILYFIAGAFKLDGEVWIEGTALYYITHVYAYAAPFDWLIDLMKNPWVTTLGTYVSVIYLVGFVFMLFSRFHWAWALLGIGFHVGIAVMMGLYSFSAIMIAMILFSLRDSEWRAILDFVGQGVVYIDGYCPYCRATGRAIERFDWLHRLEVRDFRRDQSYQDSGITAVELESQMHLVNGGEVLRGYDAVLGVLARTPLGMLAWPLARLAKSLGLGPKAYRWLAEHRIIVPDPQSCQDGSCPVHAEKP